MSKFTNSYMTNAGKKLMFGGGQVTYTRAALFTQDVSAMSVDAIRKLDALDGQILSANVGIASQRPQDNGNSTIKVEATFSNAGQKQDAKFASVGWFAKTASTSETLIAVCEVEGGILGAGDPSGASTASINASVNITIGDSTTVTALVDPSGTVTKTVLDSELAKKDDTTDVDAKINSNVTKLNQAINTKANASDVYTKTETDNQINKFDLSKVKFRKQYLNGDGQTADKTWSATKNDDGTYTIDLYNDDGTAAKLADVIAQLPNKADTSTVNAQIADAKNTIKSNADNLQSAINTKANASDLSALQNSAMQVIDGNSGDDILSFRDEKIRRYNDTQNVKNLPGMSNINWFYVITHTKSGDWGNVTVISQDNCYWQNVLNGSNWRGWVKHATSVDITDLQNQVNGKANASDLANKADKAQITDLQNQISELKDNQFEVQTFTDATAAANWEAQKPGHRLAIVNK